jgi:fumarate reductase subunit D
MFKLQPRAQSTMFRIQELNLILKALIVQSWCSFHRVHSGVWLQNVKERLLGVSYSQTMEAE